MTYLLINGYNSDMENTENTLEKKRGRPFTVGASVKMTILLDPDRAGGLDALAAKTQRSRNSLIREAVDDLLKKQEGTR